MKTSGLESKEVQNHRMPSVVGDDYDPLTVDLLVFLFIEVAHTVLPANLSRATVTSVLPIVENKSFSLGGPRPSLGISCCERTTVLG